MTDKSTKVQGWIVMDDLEQRKVVIINNNLRIAENARIFWETELEIAVKSKDAEAKNAAKAGLKQVLLRLKSITSILEDLDKQIEERDKEPENDTN